MLVPNTKNDLILTHNEAGAQSHAIDGVVGCQMCPDRVFLWRFPSFMTAGGITFRWVCPEGDLGHSYVSFSFRETESSSSFEPLNILNSCPACSTSTW